MKENDLVIVMILIILFISIFLFAVINDAGQKKTQQMLESCQTSETKDQPSPGVEGESQLTEDMT